MVRKLRRGRRGPQFICDRTGCKYPLAEAKQEPGTNLLVHFIESDGVWSRTKHPQANPIKIRAERTRIPDATGNPDTQADPPATH